MYTYIPILPPSCISLPLSRSLLSNPLQYQALDKDMKGEDAQVTVDMEGGDGSV